jgi:hypothetical protein
MRITDTGIEQKTKGLLFIDICTTEQTDLQYFS